MFIPELIIQVICVKVKVVNQVSNNLKRFVISTGHLLFTHMKCSIHSFISEQPQLSPVPHFLFQRFKSAHTLRQVPALHYGA